MLYLIGLGLNKESFSYEAMNAIKNCRKIHLDSYTVELPYNIEELQEIIGKKIEPLTREEIESDFLIKETKEGNTALLVYGNPLMATTHISLIQEAKKAKIPCRVIHGASILDAVSETGLQIYKFGKITSMPKWQTDKSKNYEPTSFMTIVKENQSINAHTLILVDIELSFKEAIRELEISAKKESVKLDKIIVCERLGLQNSRIYYNTLNSISKLNLKAPFCFIIPASGEKGLHFLEEEALKNFK